MHNDCIFCKIANGEMETPGVFWEDEKHMAFLSIFPNTEGFTVVIPKEHKDSDILELPDDDIVELVIAAKKVARILKQHFDDVGRVGLFMEGMGVNHAHVKLFPMHGTDFLKRGEWKTFESAVNTYFDKYPGYLSSHNGPRADDKRLQKLAEALRKTANDA